MKMKKIPTTWYALAVMMLLANLAIAQEQTLRLDEKSSKVLINGTSTIHDWQAKVGQVSGSLLAGKAFAGFEKDAQASVQLAFKSSTIEGGRGETMDNKIKNALKESVHPEIKFTSSQAVIIQAPVRKGGESKVKASGKVMIAGVEQAIDLELTGLRLPDGSLQFKGEKALNMRDFAIEPPTAMFGQIVTGETITLVFDLHFRK